MDSLRTLADVFRNRNLRRLELATAGSVLGNWGYLVALYVYAYDEGGASAVGIVTVMRMIPAALTAPFTASLADRFDRKLVMVGADCARAALMVLAAMTIWLDAPSAVVYCIVALSTIVSGAFMPAEVALLPSLARTPGELTAANVATSTVYSTAEFVGPAIGGLLLVVSNVPIVFLVNAASFLWSAALVIGIHSGGAPEADPHAEPDSKTPEPSVGRLANATAGARAILGNRDLRLLSGLYTAQMLVAGAFEVLIVLIAFELLHTGEGGIGYLNAAVGIGGLLGGFVALFLAARYRLASDFGLGLVVYGLPLVFIALFVSVPVALVALAIVGLGNAIVDINATTIMQRAVPDAVLGRALGALDAILLAAIGVGALLTPACIRLVGLRAVLIVTGLLLPMLAIASGSALRSLDAKTKAPAHVDRIRAIAIFKALPESMIERLASSLGDVRVPAGQTIIQEGDAGDLFYIIEEGEVEVAGSTLGEGESFGEIALLRNVPRTATVVAKTDVVLYTIERDVFVAVITGHEPAHAAAEAVVSARLTAFASDRVRFIN